MSSERVLANLRESLPTRRPQLLASARYNDYAMSPWEFRWESQSLTRDDAAVSVFGVRGLREPRSGADLVFYRVAIPAAFVPVMALAV